MRFLKRLEATFEPKVRTQWLNETEAALKVLTTGSAPIERDSSPREIARLKKARAEHRASLKREGDLTQSEIFGLPISGGKSNPRRSRQLRIEDTVWEESHEVPQLLSVDGDHFHDIPIWIYDGAAYLALDPDLTPEDVVAIVGQAKNARRIALEKAHSLQAMAERLDKPRQRERIPQEVRVEVWQRDAGRCAECGEREMLEFDHIIPFAMGGSNTARNLQLLCGDCNRRKGMSLG